MNRRRNRQPLREERGAVLILAAVFMVAIVVIAAIVVDLGQLRGTRRQAQSATDLAALAAGYHLSGRGSPEGEAKSDPRAACQAALDSIKANVSDFPLGSGLDCNSLPANGVSPTCTNLTPSTTLTATASAPYTLKVTYPVPATEIEDARYSGGVGADDGSQQCQRMRIWLGRTNDALFAGIVGIDSLDTQASAVLRADTSALGEGVAALLLLERVACGTLQTSGGGSGGAGIVVRASGPMNPGVIQADSAGPVGPCTTNQNASGYVVWGTALPSASGGGPSILAQSSPGGVPGIIGIRSLTVGGRGGAVEGTGISPNATGSEIMSRRAADVKYNTPTANGGNAQITNLHDRGYKAATMSAATALAQGYAVYSGLCSGSLGTVPDVKIYIDCPGGFAAGDATIFPNATDVVFNGKVSVPNNKLLSMPNAQRIYVRGCITSCGGGNNFSISVAGELRINTGGDGTQSTQCSNRAGPGVGGTTTNWTEVATFSGPMKVTNQIRLCQTFVYLGENRSDYVIRTQTQTGVAPENYPAVAQCSATKPCPSNGGGAQSIDISSGGGAVDWSAPNQLATRPTFSQLATYPFEDLALWTEASALSTIKGQGYSRTEGIYFSPNSPMEFTGQAAQAQPLNAQFLSRTLNVSGQGTLDLRPSPEDSILMPLPGSYVLIR